MTILQRIEVSQRTQKKGGQIVFLFPGSYGLDDLVKVEIAKEGGRSSASA